jgi:NADPH:quinone reductase-like Zn-dependent oxidoreductase
VKAVILRAPPSLDKLDIVELPPPPPPGPGEIQVRIRACSLNFHDLAVAVGALPVAPPRIPLSDAAGEVAAIGEGVEEFVAGDRVISTFFPTWHDGPPSRSASFAATPGDGVDGFAREIVNAPASWFTRQPRGFSHAEAAALPCAGVTAWRALVVNGALKAGDSVLTQGAGGVSLFALQLAKAMGARVIATSSSEEKLSRLKALGADQVINYRSHPDWARLANAYTDGVGVDHVVDVGGAGTLEQSCAAARIGGHIHMIGLLGGPQGAVGPMHLLSKQLRISAVLVGNRRHQLDLVQALEATGVRPALDQDFPLDRLADALRRMQSGAHFGKITVSVAP